jgi:hypothetical protein
MPIEGQEPGRRHGPLGHISRVEGPLEAAEHGDPSSTGTAPHRAVCAADSHPVWVNGGCL